jgi:hypothetical protein
LLPWDDGIVAVSTVYISQEKNVRDTRVLQPILRRNLRIRFSSLVQRSGRGTCALIPGLAPSFSSTAVSCEILVGMRPRQRILMKSRSVRSLFRISLARRTV